MSQKQKRMVANQKALVVGLIAAILILSGILIYTVIRPLVIYDWSIKNNVTEDIESTLKTNQEQEATFLKTEEAVVMTATTSDETTLLPIDKVLFEYVEVVDSCGAHYDGECLRVRTRPSIDAPVIGSLRNGMVLKVGGRVENEDRQWYKIVFDEWLRYPNRVKGDWYIAADYVKVLKDEGEKFINEVDKTATVTKKIVVVRSEQKLYAYDNDELFLETSISTGIELTPTPRGTFKIFKKTPSRYMQGPLPYLNNQKYYDLPGVPWNLYFTEQGAVIHGAYWHNSFGSRYSSGCVNLLPETAYILYNWAELGTTVIVKD